MHIDAEPSLQLLPLAFFDRQAHVVAAELIGATLTIGGVGGIIVETEAYAKDDPASHSFNGPTKRNAAMFGPYGHAYVYRSYGLHWCLNFVCVTGSAVLIRALDPRWAIATMTHRRRIERKDRLCAGPGRLSQALGIDGSYSGLPLNLPPFRIGQGVIEQAVVSGPRVGIGRGTDTPWRFCLHGSPFLSRAL